VKTLILLICTVCAGLAQTTTVTGSIRDPAGDLVSGSCAFQAAELFSSGAGWTVIGAPMTVPFAAGALAVALAPTDTATPSGQYYKMTCGVPRQSLPVGSVGPYSFGPTYLLVPTSGSPLDIGTLEVSPAPASPSFVVQWSQMAPLGALTGQGPIWSGSSWLPGYAGLTNYSTIEGLAGYPSTFPPTNGGNWAGTWQTHAPSYFQAALSAYSTISGLSGYPSTFPPTNSGDWAGTWQTHAPSYFQTALSAYSTISGLSGYPSTFPPTNSGDWAGTWQTHAPSYFQTALSAYSTISGLSGYPSTFPPTNSGDWAGTWQTHAPSYFQAALSAYSTISGLSGYPSTFPPTNSGDWAGTWQTHAPNYFQAALTNYSTISGLTGYPSTFPPTNSGNWAGTWQGTSPSAYALLNSPSFTTPVLGAATATSLLASGTLDGQAPVAVTTGASCTIGTTSGCTAVAYNSGYVFNEDATAGAAITYTLPTAAAGKQYCFGNAYNGSAPDTGTLALQTSAAGQYIIYTDGTLSASDGYVISAGAAADFACLVGVDATHWMFRPSEGAWARH
jgi:hypothetical protein